MGRVVGVAWPVLLYRGTCPRCRLLSRMVVVLSGLAIRRIANTTAEAAAIYAHYAEPAGKLALVHRGKIYVGRRVFVVAWWAITWCWVGRILRLGRLGRRTYEEAGV